MDERMDRLMVDERMDRLMVGGWMLVPQHSKGMLKNRTADNQVQLKILASPISCQLTVSVSQGSVRG